MELPSNHVPDLWFPDGNVVIRVGERVCCVYKGFLASQSPVLSDMFSFPQPQSVDTYMGLPTVTFPDAEKDVEYWLKTLLIPGYFQIYPGTIEAKKLFAVLRLSHKYDVQYFRRCALQHLARYYATDLDEQCRLLRSKEEFNIEGSGNIRFETDVYLLAFETGTPWLIPSLTYTLHKYSSIIGHSIDHLAACLSPFDLAKVWRIRGLVEKKIGMDSLVHALDDNSVGCSKGMTCASDTCRLLTNLYRAYGADPLGFSPPSVLSSALCSEACSSCSAVLQERHRELCEAFWAALPEQIGLGTWVELRAIKARDLGQPTED
ncbi:hypothetical protein BD626DRAFT_404615 [Schizophyllum amplum]|uniref:BTB domain-containing protein n=1 Tax=Schizophyllum amplum TaxID=97359 RepID=A0A550CBQ2_9AGAR|nr:hypothetical protein BD626DRAFT_404615 [Auriculariopsis ampla]